MQYQIAASPVSEKEMVIALVSGNRAEESISCHNDRIGDTRRKMGKRDVMESICDTCSISRIWAENSYCQRRKVGALIC